MTPGDEPPLRIGTAERTAAMRALDEHLEAGRLTVEEYGERSAHAANATLASELRALFTDLPAPHPQLPGSVPAVPPVVPLPASSVPGVPAGRPGSALEVWGPRVVAVMPLVALALFLLTKQWIFFLLIPAAGALIYGGRRDDHRERRRR